MTPPKVKVVKPKKEPKPRRRFGIGEWYGKSFTTLTTEERRFYASIQSLSKDEKPKQPCPFKLGNPVCTKAGGICSLRLYEESPATGEVKVAAERSTLRVTCPYRFEQDGTVYGWIGNVILGDANAVPTGQTPFLQPVETMGEVDPGTRREVGRIDNVLVIPNTDPLQWCPVEIQSVYFSGEKMSLDFNNIFEFAGSGLPFPVKNRRPDYRSSGPKRLLPQLETKVPTLSMWGKKTAVVVDEDFFNQLGKMKAANDITNSEVLWFVVRFEETDGGFVLRAKGEPFMTKLKEAVDALVAAIPLPRPKFEAMVLEKLRKVLANS